MEYPHSYRGCSYLKSPFISRREHVGRWGCAKKMMWPRLDLMRRNRSAEEYLTHFFFVSENGGENWGYPKVIASWYPIFRQTHFCIFLLHKSLGMVYEIRLPHYRLKMNFMRETRMENLRFWNSDPQNSSRIPFFHCLLLKRRSRHTKKNLFSGNTWTTVAEYTHETWETGWVPIDRCLIPYITLDNCCSVLNC